MIKQFENLLFVCRFNFKLFFLIRGYILASSDYVDALELGLIPEYDSLYRVPNIFINYIKNQFSKEEKEWLIKYNNYGMKIESIFE